MPKLYLSPEQIDSNAMVAYYNYHHAMGQDKPPIWSQEHKDAFASVYSADAPVLTDAERAPWLAVAEALAPRVTIEPGFRATLRASRDFPATEIEMVEEYREKRGKVRFPDGSIRDIPLPALIDWCSEWTKGHICSHIDNFGSRGPHPITGEPWPKGVQPDLLKAANYLQQIRDES